MAALSSTSLVSSLAASAATTEGPVKDTKPVAANHRFDEAALAAYMRTNVDGFSYAEKSAALSVWQFAWGQSNPTYFLQVGSGVHQRRYVMRKKPPGKLLPSAHAIEREYRIMTALRNSRVPVPRTYALCTDSALIGTPFFIMDYVHGRILKQADLPGLPPDQRFAIYSAMNQTLAALHSVDVKAVGLSDYGHTLKYVERQVRRWNDQYNAAQTEDIPAVTKLAKYLIDNLPTDDDSKTITLVHGDFRLDNLILHPTEPRVLAVLDWELSTLGHPTTDLAYNCLPYYCPSDLKLLTGLNGLDIRRLGIPSEKDYLVAYIRNSSRHGAILNWNYYVALSFFRSASISQGVMARSLQGNASSPHAKQFGEITKIMAGLGEKISARGDKPKELKDSDIKPDYQLAPFGFSQSWYRLRAKLLHFMDEYVYPNEATYDAQHRQLTKEAGHPWVNAPILEVLKTKAKAAGLWNLFMAKNPTHPHAFGAGLTNLEYAPLCEIMGRSLIAPEVFNCSAPDTGNMEVLAVFGSPAQQQKWLVPLLAGEIRSVFGMTEPQVASSDASNIECSIQRADDCYIINGRKWWTSGAMDPRAKICILMGKTATTGPKYRQQSMILVPMDAPGVKIVRSLDVYGFDDSPHGHAEVLFDNVRVPLDNILLGEGRGFEIAQARLGPGRIHHCMRTIGLSERALELMVRSVQTRSAFGTLISKKGTILHDIAESRIEITSSRLLTLQAASLMDTVGNKVARQQIAMIKVSAPNMALKVIDRAVQAHGGKGVSGDTPLARWWTAIRTLRLADGPDEVHRETIAKIELTRAKL